MNVAVSTRMNTCQNCGQVNSAESQFCRFCGTKFTQQHPQPQPQQYSPQPRAYEFTPPRPYAWQTDEYQTKSEPRGTANAGDPMTQRHVQFPVQPAPLANRGMQFMDPNYRCPNCMSQFLPKTERRISTAGWIVFAVLLVAFFPLFWVGLLIKEDVHTCPSCSTRIAA
jgi:RNA polymerase subunit RPABC4/transcription elongation factor Spt4